MKTFVGLVLGLAAPAFLLGCPAPGNADTGVDAAASGARGLVRWGSVSCDMDYSTTDGGAPRGSCTPPSQHSSNTAINGTPSATTMTCAASVGAGGQAVTVGFTASETLDPSMWPGTLSLRGVGGAAAVPATMVGQTVAQCEVRLVEGPRTVVGHCGAECTVTITQVTNDGQTITGRIRCLPAADDGTPPRFRTVRNGDGVPGMDADFALVLGSCTAP